MYNVYVGLPPYLAPTFALDYDSIIATLQGWYTQVTNGVDCFGPAQVQLTRYTPDLQNYELLVYLVASKAQSAIALQLDLDAVNSGASSYTQWTSPGGTGFTTQLPAHGNAYLSEVYAQECGNLEYSIASVIFHESMHNKLGVKRDLHSYPGVSLGAIDAASANSGLSDADLNLMVMSLGNAHPQWVGSFASQCPV